MPSREAIFSTHLVYISQPLDYVLEALLVRYVIDEHYAHGAAVVGRGYRMESLLAGGVPYLKLDLLALQLHCFDFEVDA